MKAEYWGGESEALSSESNRSTSSGDIARQPPAWQAKAASNESPISVREMYCPAGLPGPAGFPFRLDSNSMQGMRMGRLERELPKSLRAREQARASTFFRDGEAGSLETVARAKSRRLPRADPCAPDAGARLPIACEGNREGRFHGRTAGAQRRYESRSGVREQRREEAHREWSIRERR